MTKGPGRGVNDANPAARGDAFLVDCGPEVRSRPLGYTKAGRREVDPFSIRRFTTGHILTGPRGREGDRYGEALIEAMVE